MLIINLAEIEFLLSKYNIKQKKDQYVNNIKKNQRSIWRLPPPMQAAIVRSMKKDQSMRNQVAKAFEESADSARNSR